MRRIIAALVAASTLLLVPASPATAAPWTCDNTWRHVPSTIQTYSEPAYTRTDEVSGGLDWRAFVVVRATDNTVRYTTGGLGDDQPPGPWAGTWTSLGGTTYQAPNVGRMILQSALRVVVAVIGTDGNTYRRWTTLTGWSPGWVGSVGTWDYNTVGQNASWGGQPEGHWYEGGYHTDFDDYLGVPIYSCDPPG